MKIWEYLSYFNILWKREFQYIWKILILLNNILYIYIPFNENCDIHIILNILNTSNKNPNYFFCGSVFLDKYSRTISDRTSRTRQTHTSLVLYHDETKQFFLEVNIKIYGRKIRNIPLLRENKSLEMVSIKIQEHPVS